MIDSTGRCTVCGILVGPGLIHSCSGTPSTYTWPPSTPVPCPPGLGDVLDVLREIHRELQAIRVILDLMADPDVV